MRAVVKGALLALLCTGCFLFSEATSTVIMAWLALIISGLLIVTGTVSGRP
jgi:hypothetical protein